MENENEERRCRVCGCTESHACMTEDGPCYWVEDDLCSACATEEQKAKAHVIIDVSDIRTPDTIAAEINGAMSALRNFNLIVISSIGEKLIEARNLLPHGEWSGWLERNIKFTDRTARNYMKIAEEFPKISKTEIISDLTMTDALMLIALPESAREELVIKVDSGEIEAEDISEEIEALRRKAKALEEQNRKLQCEMEDMVSPDELEKLRAAASQVDRLKTDLRDAKSEAKDSIRKKIDEEVEKARQEITEKAESATAEELERLKANLVEAQSRAEKAEKAAQVAGNEDKVQVKLLADQIQTDIQRLVEIINKAPDPESATKWRNLLRAILENWMQAIYE